MTIMLNHTIVPTRDKEASARSFAQLFGLRFEGRDGHFAPVRVSEAFTLLFDGTRNRSLATEKEKTMRNTQLKSDLDTLLDLNRDYIRSVQTSDTRRFDEILADDFLCSNPDGSLVDRQGFLQQTALPVRISNLEAHDIKVRIMGDFAIIHARTAYTRPDADRDRADIPTYGRVGTALGSPFRRTSRVASVAASGSAQPMGLRPPDANAVRLAPTR